MAMVAGEDVGDPCGWVRILLLDQRAEGLVGADPLERDQPFPVEAEPGVVERDGPDGIAESGPSIP